MGAGESGKWYVGPLKSGTPLLSNSRQQQMAGV